MDQKNRCKLVGICIWFSKKGNLERERGVGGGAVMFGGREVPLTLVTTIIMRVQPLSSC